MSRGDDDDDGTDPQMMLARIQSLENRASLLQEENTAVFETNKELYKVFFAFQFLMRIFLLGDVTLFIIYPNSYSVTFSVFKNSTQV